MKRLHHSKIETRNELARAFVRVLLDMYPERFEILRNPEPWIQDAGVHYKWVLLGVREPNYQPPEELLQVLDTWATSLSLKKFEWSRLMGTQIITEFALEQMKCARGVKYEFSDIFVAVRTRIDPPRLPTWQPTLESWESYKNRADKHLDEYKRTVEDSMKNLERKLMQEFRKPDLHLRWTALHIVKSLTYEQIAEPKNAIPGNPAAAKTVEEAIQNIMEILHKRSRGRPRKDMP